MHELGIIQELLEIAQEKAQENQARRIHALTLRVGALAGVEVEALAFAFGVATAGTLAEGATLTLESVAIRCHCERCEREFEPAGFIFACPACGHLTARVTQGRELELVQMEIS